MAGTLVGGSVASRVAAKAVRWVVAMVVWKVATKAVWWVDLWVV